ncbi:MAG: FGGY-family carbohydrate kinase [Clostridiales bacterium]|jgi:sugar (pentulose or hexulose) kinase|nr:FGGY-family carbohydrate kinase [Clostridiales bacterium]
MADRYLLGYDIGTMGSKGVIIDEGGRVLASKTMEHGVSVPRPAWAEQDAEELYWGEFKKITRQLLAEAHIDPKQIAGIGVSGLTPDIVPVDREGNAVRPCIIYMDRRATAECDIAMEKFGGKVFEVSGNIADPYFAGYKAMWYARNEKERYDRTWKLLNSHAFVVLKLTGEAVVDYGVAGLNAPFFDQKQLKWSGEMIEGCGMDTDKFPTAYAAHEVVGTVRRRAAEETGLAEGTPVIAGGGVDASSSAFSVGMVGPGESSCMYGTTHCWQIVLPEPKFDDRFINFPHIVPGSYVALAGLGTSGAIIKWFRDNFGALEKEYESERGTSAYKLLDLEAAAVPKGADGLVLLPYFMGERSPIWDPKARGVFFGLSLYHTRGHMFRSVLEGIGYALEHHAEILREQGLMPKRIVAVDAGASSNLFRQVITDIMNTPQDYMAKVSGAPVADAFLAGLGVGVYKDFGQIRDWVRYDQANVPDPASHAVYRKLYQIYRNLYEKTKDDMHVLADMA